MKDKNIFVTPILEYVCTLCIIHVIHIHTADIYYVVDILYTHTYVVFIYVYKCGVCIHSVCSYVCVHTKKSICRQQPTPSWVFFVQRLFTLSKYMANTVHPQIT